MNNKLGGPLSLHPDEEMIKVGNDVWIGQGVSVVRKPGLEIGDGAVIGSGAVVTKSIPPYAIAAGVPARVIGYRFDENITKRLLALKWWDWPAEKIFRNLEVLCSSDLERIKTIEE
jgi:virginiamycin A acetyltransferase